MPNLYEVSNGAGEPRWRRKQGDAHDVAKTMVPRGDVRIRLYDYPGDIDTIEGLFNGVKPAGGLKRAWAITARGGMQEIEIDKALAELAEEKDVGDGDVHGPFYWSHPESGSYGQTDSRADLEQLMARDPCCEEITQAQYDKLNSIQLHPERTAPTQEDLDSL